MKESWKGKKVVILGFGQFAQGSGVAATQYFAKQGADVTVVDFYYSKAMEPHVKLVQKKFPRTKFVFSIHDLSVFPGADLVVKHQRLRQSEPEVQEVVRLGLRMESAESVFLKLCPCPVVGVTGTRGKSTTTTLAHEMLSQGKRKVWLGGNILVSPLTFLSKIKKDDLVVLELSSFQLEGTGSSGVSPHIACVTNIMRDHLNAYSGMEEYAEAKAQIFRHQSPSDVVVLNADDATDRQFAKEAPGEVLLFTKKQTRAAQAWLTDESLVLRGELLVKKRELHVAGEHLYLNMLAASLLASAAGASLAQIRRTLKSFRGLPDRQEVVAVKQGITYINDTCATTPDGAIAAIKTFDTSGGILGGAHKGTLRLILGGSDKELVFDGLAKELKKRHIDIVVLPGNAHDKLTKSLSTQKVPYQDVETLKEAVAVLRDHATRGDIILLSPACTSFGMFANEFARGDEFRKCVRD